MGGGDENLSDREFPRTKARIAAAAALWEQEKRDPSRLLAEGRLSTEGDESLSRQELSSNLIDSVQNSAAQARRRQRRWGLRSGLLAVLVVLAGLSGSFAQDTDVTASREALRVEEIARIEDDGDTVPRLAFSPDSRVLVLRSTGSRTGDARLIEAATGGELARFGRVVAFSPDGRWLVTRNEDGTARLIEAATGTEAMVIGPVVPGAPSEGVAFSPDSSLLAAAGHVLYLIETASGAERARLGSAASIAFSPDSRWLAAGSLLIETATGTEVARVEHDGPVGAVAFGPDGRLLATASTTGTAPALQSTVRLLRVNP